jgi:hypothetical protein
MRYKNLKERLWYRIELFIGRGGLSMFYALAIILFSTIVLLLGLRYLLLWMLPESKLPQDLQKDDFLENAFHLFMEVTDPGTMGNFLNTSPWITITGVLAAMCGIVIFSLLVAIITSTVEQILHRFSQGTTVVHEKNHFLIIGTNSRLIDILKEFVIASETEKLTVVILSEKTKEEVDNEIELGIEDTKNLRIVTRTGRTTSPAMLERISVDTARGVIVLSQCENFSDDDSKELSDTNVIKICYALSIAINKGHNIMVVPEIYFESNREVVKSLMSDNVLLVDTTNILSRLLVQTSLFNGLVSVYEQLFSFEGSELYVINNPAPGMTFGELAFHLKDGIPLGYRCPKEGLVLNPDIHKTLDDDKKIILVLSDDSHFSFSGSPIAKGNKFAKVTRTEISNKRHILIIGWNSDSENIIREYDKYLSKDSHIQILLTEKCQPNEKEFALLKKETKCEVDIIETEDTSSIRLEALKLASYDMIVLLTAFLNTDQTEVVDSENIKLLLQVKRILNKEPNGKKPIIISEVLDTSNLELFDHMGLSDFLLSNRLISIFLTQLAVQPGLMDIYEILLSKDGAEINLKPATHYFSEFNNLTFADLISAGQNYGEIILGYKRILRKANEFGRYYETVLNPDKNALTNLSAQDFLIVLSNDNG